MRVRSNRPEYSPEFEQAWLAYPKRAGGNLKSAAFKAWKARLNEGVNPETMLEGVKRYAGWVSAMGNSGTQFVKQAVTFFGPDRHFESLEVPAVSAARRIPVLQSQLRQRGLQPDPGRIQGVIMSLLNEVQKFIEAHPGCTSGDIADAFAGYSRQRVLQSASKLRQSGRVAHRCEGDTRRHFPRLTERAQEPEPQSVRETRPVRNFYVGTNDPRVILCLTRQAENQLGSYSVELQRCGWRHSVKATPSQNETIFWRVVSGAYGKAASALYRVMNGICQGITWGLNDDVNSMSAAGAGYADFLPARTWLPANQEVATMLGYRSVNAAVEHLRALEKKGVITIKRGVARGITLHTAMKDDDSEAVGIIRSLLAGEENARLRQHTGYMRGA